MGPPDIVGSAIAAPEPELLTWDEIRARHPDAWVCLADVAFTHPHKLSFRTARLIGHGKTRSESREQATRLFPRYQDVVNIYTTDLEITYSRPRLIIDAETSAALRNPR
jgi:hypothetical protein